jgi:hypothetical protein
MFISIGRQLPSYKKGERSVMMIFKRQVVEKFPGLSIRHEDLEQVDSG